MAYSIGSNVIISDDGNITAKTVTALSHVTGYSSDIGTAGGQGFGVGVYPSFSPPSGFTAMTGSTDQTSANYGNYTYSDGSIMVWIPAFWYRIGNVASPRYATWGENAIDIAPYSTYATETAANAAGYSLHRAFIDGGQIKKGFFIDKYLASKKGTTSCKSVAGAAPISLATNSNYNPSNGMTGCTGILADAVVLSKSRGTGMQCSSVFQYAALGLLSLAHAQASTSTTYNAWYDSTGIINFPKGCNNNALADVDDTTVTYTASFGAKPNCGASANFNKTTHNGQASGVADLNGSLRQVMVGLTSPGTSSTDTTQNTTGDAYVIKPSVAIADMTGGFGGTNDFWGTSANLSNNYDSITGLFIWGASIFGAYWGNGSNAAFDGHTSLVNATNNISYSRTVCGLPKDTNSISSVKSSSTDQMGKDYLFKYNVANLVPLAAGSWNYYSDAGVFYRSFYYYRSADTEDSGFRVSAYV